ncbi:glycosyltransferase [Zavarzinia compransoris]|uniref:glycosyltransferase n=1 Tax=Zavarzinia marina TaxID=2911065 RepID=UPI001F2B86FA|nr:glycosyltransferase [Zavarzinia marina]MCF4167335.1 glycosyltransferase [Zavarzinia marina]
MRVEPARRLAIVLKGYPRLSETFIAQEILALEQAGLDLEIWSLRHPTDGKRHPLHQAIQAPVRYLPEYLRDEPFRVLKGLISGLRRRGFLRVLGFFWRDLRRDPSANRLRRLGQALVMAREMAPEIRRLHVHFLHTPASVARYACHLTGRTFSFSAHAKDIWTTPDWELREKIADSAWGVTCTRQGHEKLSNLAPDGDRVALVYHGLDLQRFPAPPARAASASGAPVALVTVGRAVEKKGFDDLLSALALMSASNPSWRLVHIGGGALVESLDAQARRLGIVDRVRFMGPLAQDGVIEALRAADVFVLPCKEGKDGDRDGLPNVIMEAATQALPIVSTRFAGVPEFVRDGIEGILVPPGDPPALARALAKLTADPALRLDMGQAALRRIADFSFRTGVETLLAKLGRDPSPCPRS